jgi:hypothetical protein
MLFVRGLVWSDGGASLRVATARGRWHSVFMTFLVVFLALAFVFGGDEGGDSGVPVSAIRTSPGLLAYVIGVGIVGVWMLARTLFMSMRLSADGIVVRNLVRTYRIRWNDVRWIGDRPVRSSKGRSSGRSQRRSPVRTAVLSTSTDEGLIECGASRFEESGREEIVAALTTVAGWHGVDVNFGDAREGPASDAPPKRTRRAVLRNYARALAFGAVVVVVAAPVASWFDATPAAPTVASFDGGNSSVSVAEADGQFRASFPSQPERSVLNDANGDITTYTSVASDGSFTVTFLPWSSEMPSDLSTMEGEARATMPGKLLSTRPTTFLHVPALESVSFDAADHLYDKEVAFVAENRWFMLDVAGVQNPPVGFGSFMDSFTLTSRQAG